MGLQTENKEESGNDWKLIKEKEGVKLQRFYLAGSLKWEV